MIAAEEVTAGFIQDFLRTNEVNVGPLRPKMVLAEDGKFYKFFYDQAGIHWSSFLPKAERFVRNAKFLRDCGFSAPNVERLLRCQELGAWIVVYPPLPGTDLRALGNASDLEKLPGFLAALHQAGAYFRGIHLGNVLLQGNQLALIDVAGMKIWPMPLTLWQRLRNVGRLLSFPDDVELFVSYGVDRFCQQYCEFAGISGLSRRWLLQSVEARVAESLAHP